MDIFITGGAGFIGCNSADHFLREGHRVTIFDNLSRVGGPANLAWLQTRHSDRLRFVAGDIRDYDALAAAIVGADVVLHLASQVAVTLSVQDPRQDFEINALGTFNVLEAVRNHCPSAAVLYASTNKVYGGMDEVRIVEQPTRYAYVDFPRGIPESYPLDFHSPYGCCYSAETDILTRQGWQRFYELGPEDEVLTYNLERKVAEFQRPLQHFAFAYEGKMYVQNHRRLQTCVTPNHNMLISWQGPGDELENLCLVEARMIEGRPVTYLVAAEYEGGRNDEHFVLPTPGSKVDQDHVPAPTIPMANWARFLGWYLSRGECHQDEKSGRGTVSLATHDRTQEAVAVMRGIGLSPVVNREHVRADSEPFTEYLRLLGPGDEKHIPQEMKELSRKHLSLLLHTLLGDEGNQEARKNWLYTTRSERLADDVQEIAVKCGLAASLLLDEEGCRQVYIEATRTAQCNLGENRSDWVDYAGMVYCVEVPNSTVMVRQNGHAYFSGNSKGAGDQYTIDYARIYGLNTLTLRQSCLAAGQEIITPFGKKPLACLRPGDLIHSGRGWTRVRKVWFTGIKPVRRLQTQNGLAVTLTADHRVVRPHGLYSNRDFAPGDFLAILPEARYTPSWEEVDDCVLEPEPFLAAVRARTGDNLSLNEAEQIARDLLPLTGDRLLALTEVVGRLFGTGRLDLPNSVHYYGTEPELQQLNQHLAWLGLPAGAIVRATGQSPLPGAWPSETRGHCIELQAIPVFTLFELLGVPVGDKDRVAYELPPWIAGGHRLVKRAFLRGFLGAELCQVDAGPASYPVTSFTQAKDERYLESGRRWLRQVRALLAEFGIESSCSDGQPIAYKDGRCLETMIRFLDSPELFARLAAIGYAFSPARSARLNSLLRGQWTQTTPEHAGQITPLYRADGELYWDILKTIESLPEQAVFDLEVEVDSHLLLAGGIQVSNCIYGSRQFGVEDQGWVAHFIIAAVKNKPLNIYGDGKQVRDLLHVTDLIRAYDLGIAGINELRGEVFNLGGGPENTLSIWHEFEPMLASLAGRPIAVNRGDWRPGDQRVFVADIGKAEKLLGWRPLVSPAEGIANLYQWVSANPDLF
jgi:nucleoside-diphosphate-sugar epimerase/intein/homing endonuclease